MGIKYYSWIQDIIHINEISIVIASESLCKIVIKDCNYKYRVQSQWSKPHGVKMHTLSVITYLHGTRVNITVEVEMLQGETEQ